MFHQIAEGRSEDEGDNFFDEAFRAGSVKVECEIEENTEYDLSIVEMTDIKEFGFSQFLNGDMRPSSPHQSLSCLFGISTRNLSSPSNSFDTTTPNPLSSNTASNIRSSSQIATPRSYSSEEMGIEGSQNILGDHQQHGQNNLSEGTRQLYPEPSETRFPPSSVFTANQQTPFQTPANAQLSTPFFPINPLSAPELVIAPLLNDPRQQTPMPRRKRKNALNAGRIERPPAKKGRKTRTVKVQTKEEEAAKRDTFLGRNRQAAQRCRQNKKTWIMDLLERSESSATNNTKVAYEIELAKLELEGLRAMAVEHYRVCPNPSPELTTWFEKEIVRLQQSKGSASIHYTNSPLTPPP
jgi:hypothetical protein